MFKPASGLNVVGQIFFYRKECLRENSADFCPKAKGGGKSSISRGCVFVFIASVVASSGLIARRTDEKSKRCTVVAGRQVLTVQKRKYIGENECAPKHSESCQLSECLGIA